MSYEDASAAIEARLSSSWGSTTAVKWPNVKFEPTPGTPFIELDIAWSDSRQASIESTPLHRAVGIISINVYTALNIGSKTAEDYADTLAGYYRAAQFSGITCRSPVVRTIGEMDGWWVVNMSVEFQYDKTY
jgi:hypothetical protein